MNKKILYIIIGIIIAILLGVAIYMRVNTKQGTKVAVQSVAQKDIIETVTASGKIFPVSEVKLSPDISGEVLELSVAEGEQVRRGQLLARIDARLYQGNVQRANAQVNQSRAGVENAKAQLAQLEVQLEQAKSNYNRHLKLYKDKVISAVEFEQATTSYRSLQAQIAASKQSINSSKFNVESNVAGLSDANFNIKRSNLYAPMNGIITRLNVKQGERVVGTAQMAGTEMIRIADMSLMKVEVEIGEHDIQKIKLGDSAIVEVDAYNNRKFTGFVRKIAQSNTNAAGMQATTTDQISNYTVSIEIDPSSYTDLTANGNFAFRPGMSASVEILTKHHLQTIAVPIASVTTRDLDTNDTEAQVKKEIKEYVFVVQKDNTVKLTEVKTDIQDNVNIEIISGLKIGDQVVIAPFQQIAEKLKDKDKVLIVPKKDLFDKEEIK